MQERHGQGQSRRLVAGIADRAADEDQRNRSHVHQIAAGVLTRRVAGCHVRNFVRHHSGQLRFLVCRQDQSGIDIEKTTRQSEGIDVVGVDYLDCERHLRIGIAHQVLSHPVDVFSHHRVLDQLHRGFDLLGILLAHGDLFLHAIPVAQSGLAAHVAIAYSFDIRLAAVVFDLVRIRRLDFRYRRHGSGGLRCVIGGVLILGGELP